MPNLLRSRMLALALAACAFACAVLFTGPAGATQRRTTAPRKHFAHHPFRFHAKWRLPKRLLHRKRTLGQRAARIALKAVGVPYRWGGTSPSSGFDCSGLVYWTYRRLGISLPHSSYALAGTGRAIRSSHLRPGDLLFFWGNGHVGIYVGHGRMVHAPHAGERVQVVRLAASGYGRALDAARRVR